MNKHAANIFFLLTILFWSAQVACPQSAPFEFIVDDDAKVPRIKYLDGQTLVVGDTLSLNTDSCELSRLLLQTSVDIEGMRTFKSLGKTCWSLSAIPLEGSVKSMEFNVRWGYNPSDASFHSEFLQITATASDYEGNTRTLLSKKLHEGVSTVKGKNTLTLTWTSGKFRLWIGAGKPVYVGCIDEEIASPAEFILRGNRKMKVGFLSCTYYTEPQIPHIDSFMAAKVVENLSHIADKNTIEGCWDFFDRDTESRYARKGGNYKLAVVKSLTDVKLQNANPIYDIIYLDGAEVNSAKWKPFMLKGHLYPTPFAHRFKLIWYDAHKTKHRHECFAEYDPDLRMLKLIFPLLSAELRFTPASPFENSEL